MLGMALLAFAVAACITWVGETIHLTSKWKNRFEASSAIPAKNSSNSIDWDSLPQEMVARVGAPGMNISQPIARPMKITPTPICT